MLLIPINMRDGSLICVGKDNPDWNYSAPARRRQGTVQNKRKGADQLRGLQEDDGGWLLGIDFCLLV